MNLTLKIANNAWIIKIECKVTNKKGIRLLTINRLNNKLIVRAPTIPKINSSINSHKSIIMSKKTVFLVFKKYNKIKKSLIVKRI